MRLLREEEHAKRGWEGQEDSATVPLIDSCSVEEDAAVEASSLGVGVVALVDEEVVVVDGTDDCSSVFCCCICQAGRAEDCCCIQAGIDLLAVEGVDVVVVEGGATPVLATVKELVPLLAGISVAVEVVEVVGA